MGMILFPTLLWTSERLGTLVAMAYLQAPLFACGVLMGCMLGMQRRGGKHTNPSVLWLVSRLNLFPTPAIFMAMHWLGCRRYYDLMPMPEEGMPVVEEGEDVERGNADDDGDLLVGGLPLPWHVLQLRGKGVRAIVNLCDEFGGWTRLYDTLGIVQLRLPTTDYMDVSAANLGRAIDFIDIHREQGHGVYVHCKAGVGRAGSVAVAYLAARSDADARLDLESANAYVRRYRPAVASNLYQRSGVRTVVKRRRASGEGVPEDMAAGVEHVSPLSDGDDDASPPREKEP